MHRTYHFDERTSVSSIDSLRARSLSDTSRHISPVRVERKPKEFGKDMLALKLIDMQSRAAHEPRQHHLFVDRHQPLTRQVAPRTHTKSASTVKPYAQNEVINFQKRLQTNHRLLDNVDPNLLIPPDDSWKADKNKTRHIDFIEQLNRSLRRERWEMDRRLRTQNLSHSFSNAQDHESPERSRILTGYLEERDDNRSPTFKQRNAAPVHPLWDTPEELRTSVNFNSFL